MQQYIINSLLDELGLGFVYPLEHTKQNPNQDYIFEESRGWHNTKWIMLSSSFFSIPAFRAFSMIYRLSKPIDTYATYMAILLILSSLVSMNYWRDAKRGWRRNMDMILAKITFLTGVYYGIIYVPGVSKPSLFVVSTENIPYPMLFYSSIALSLYTYSQSTKYAFKNDDTWVKYHFAFHVFVFSLRNRCAALRLPSGSGTSYLSSKSYACTSLCPRSGLLPTIGVFSIMEPLYFYETRG